MSDGGKGSSPRPYSVPKEQYDENFHKVFGELPTKHCVGCNKLPSWCVCGISVDIKPEADDHLGGGLPKPTDVSIIVNKTWEF